MSPKNSKVNGDPFVSELFPLVGEESTGTSGASCTYEAPRVLAVNVGRMPDEEMQCLYMNCPLWLHPCF